MNQQEKTGTGAAIACGLVIVFLLYLTHGGLGSPPPTPDPATSPGTSALKASHPLVRVSQLDPTQYRDQAEYEEWSPSACSAASMTEVINAYSDQAYRITDILQVERGVGAISAQLGLLNGAQGIAETVKHFGFQARSLEQATLDTVIRTANAGQPVIVAFPPERWTGGHLLVVRGGDDNTVTLADSSQFNMTGLSRAKFLTYWAGFAVLVAPLAAQRSSGAKGAGGLSVIGQPSIRASLIDQILARFHSPAAGKGQALYDLGVKYGIDPAVALAFFQHESTFGTKGEATATLGLGNERCIPDRPCIDQDRGGYAQFYSWEDGFEHWYQLMRDGYALGAINKVLGRTACPCLTIEQIIPVYAPAHDHNNEAAYIRAVTSSVLAWRAGKVVA